ncbi:MAG: hypothetical protein JNK82_19855 [Myxococcaceae bacterium]|nr:hypothetical protein [Myxococcaceae bacterium]
MRLVTLSLFLTVVACSSAGVAPCSASTCAGCCDPTGVCRVGADDGQCGAAGNVCTACSANQVCTAGACTARVGGDGGTAGDGGTRGTGGGSGNPGTGGGGGSSSGTGGGGGALPLPVVSRCAGSLIECGFECVDPSTDESNCGQCGTRCMAGLVCNRGACEALPADCVVNPCPGDFGCNPQTRTCMQQCFSDADCRGGAECSTAGRCTCPAGSQACGDRCVSAYPVTSTCRCEPGFEGLGECVDVDECSRGLSTCGPNATCQNQIGSFSCTCNAGYKMEGGACVVDRCATNNGGCSPKAQCYSYGGQSMCQCNSGYDGDGVTCTPVCYPGGSCPEAGLACYPVTTYEGRCETAGSGGPGAACTTNSNCMPGTRCERMASGVSGFCATTCYSTGGAGCTANEQCVFHDGAYVCLARSSQACNALAQNCASGACVAYMATDVCMATSNVAIGQPCMYVNECVAGSVCMGNATSGYTCRPICDPMGPACPAGSGTCAKLSDRPWGGCVP